MPAETRPQTFQDLRIEDIDRAVKEWFDRVMDSHVVDPAGGDRRKVAVVFAAGERWVTGRDQRGIRDKDGQLILPVISLRRLGIDPINGMMALGSNVPTLQIARKVAEKTGKLSSLDYSRPHSSRRLRGADVYEITTIPFPFNGVISYELVIQAQYMAHMNAIIEKMLSKLEFFEVPTFVAVLRDHRNSGIQQGDGAKESLPEIDAPYESRQPLDRYYVCGYFDGDIGDNGNLEEFTDQERIVRMSLNFKVPSALMLDPEGERPAAQKVLTSFNLSLGNEECHFFDSAEELDAVFSSGRLIIKERKRR